MAASLPLPIDAAEHVGAIAQLSDELRVPMHEVQEIFVGQLQRLESHARIRSYLGLLAARNTRWILRGAHKVCFGADA